VGPVTTPLPPGAVRTIGRMPTRPTEDKRLELIVGEAPGARSGLWRFLASGDDVYVQYDAMRKDLKTSLHASGANHTAWTRGGVERWKPDGDRYMNQWAEPDDFAPGGKNLLGIVIPSDHLQVPDEEPPLEKREKITLLAPAPDGEAMHVYVAVTAPGTSLTGPGDRPSVILAEWPLPTRGTVWVIAMAGPWDGFRKAVTDALPEMEKKFVDEFTGKLTPGERKELRAVLWTDVDPAGVPHMIEVGIEAGMTDGD
jgi:hypothetical protein